MKDYWIKQGYQPYEPVRGFIQTSGGTTGIRKPEYRLNIERSGLFGQCSDLQYMSFMDSLDVEECGFDQVMNQDFCENTLSARNILDAKIYSSADLTEATPLAM